jgi:signal transduction histidine kinase
MKKTVLIVDDMPEDRQVIQRALAETEGFFLPLPEAGDGAECLQHLTEGAQIDCILLDYSLPGTDGLKVLERILETDPRVAVVMVTGNGGEEVAVKAMKMGAQDYLSKAKISPENLERVIANAIERARMQNKIREQQENLQTFSSVLVHDLRAPLRSVIGAIAMLTEDLPPDVTAEHAEMIDFIVQGAERMDKLILALKSYTEQNGAEPVFETVDLNQQLEAVRSNLAADLGTAGAKLICDVSLPTLRGSPPQIVQLFQNIIANGIKYNRSEAPHVIISVKKRARSHQISITDNGIGIESQYLQRIFEPFKRLHSHEEFEGTGLGLATCDKIMRRHGGKLWCQSAPGQGTTFFLEFPTK